MMCWTYVHLPLFDTHDSCSHERSSTAPWLETVVKGGTPPYLSRNKTNVREEITKEKPFVRE